ncbi:hypothetical protein HYS00_04220 [Candidatus Microgenomates bacterium]|nr:hypothetical protein [Candidatus Microgenomates bacterium]
MRDTYREFWQYLSKEQQDLLLQGDYLSGEIIQRQKHTFKDYSFLVFPYAKAYEGFLKQLFQDIGYISHLDYISDHLRLGKLMSPNLIDRLGDRSLYLRIEKSSGRDLAEKIWNTWKVGRNQVFHYFPHNLKALSFEEAEKLVNTIVQTMQESYRTLYEPSRKGY